MLKVVKLGSVPYEESLQAMRSFTDQRTFHTPDELWCLEHPPVFSQGLAGKAEHLLEPGDIPVVHSCRGGQVTYHGPGQFIFYPLLDLKKNALTIKSLISALENTTLTLLAHLGIQGGHRVPGAPGIYIHNRKIASLGLRIRKGYSYHGLSLNVAMDLSPFQRIHPCGIPDLLMCQLSDFDAKIDLLSVQSSFIAFFIKEISIGTLNGKHQTTRC